MPGDRERRRAIAERLAGAVAALGMSQNAFAKAFGLNRGTLNNWLKGKYQPTLEAFAEICELTGASADEILGLKEAKVAKPRVDVSRPAKRLERMQRELGALRDEIERLKR